jgi:hypothetical protein
MKLRDRAFTAISRGEKSVWYNIFGCTMGGRREVHREYVGSKKVTGKVHAKCFGEKNRSKRFPESPIGHGSPCRTGKTARQGARGGSRDIGVSQIGREAESLRAAGVLVVIRFLHGASRVLEIGGDSKDSGRPLHRQIPAGGGYAPRG